MTIEQRAEEIAEKIVSARRLSAFVSDDHQKVWIKTAIMEAYADGRVSVFYEDMNALTKAHKGKPRK